MKSSIIIFLGIIGVIAGVFFLGKHSGSENVKKELLPRINHLESQVSKRDTLLLDYKLQIDVCFTGLLETRDSLSQEIERLINDRPTRILYRSPKLVVTDNDELLDRVLEWLNNPQ